LLSAGLSGTYSNTLTLSGASNSITAGTLTATGGTINGTTIGATTATTGKFTTLEATNAAVLLPYPEVEQTSLFTSTGTAYNQITTGTNIHLALMPGGTGNVGIGTTSPNQNWRLRRGRVLREQQHPR